MKYTERREFLYDPEVFKRTDVQTALKIHAEMVRAHSGKPYPVFHELDRSQAAIDPLWHQPVGDRAKIQRTLQLPCIVQFEKKRWNMGQVGRTAQQRVKFWLSNLALKEADYFPLHGDLVYWDGYRLEIVAVEFEPNSYWQQTNVWLGIIYVADIVPDGDAKPLANPAVTAPVEMATGAAGVVNYPLPSNKV